MNTKSRKIVLAPLFTLCISILVALIIPFKIISYGYLPPDDALRHSAKVISGKDWSQILILQPGINLDSHPGWHAILTGFHRLTKCNIDGLVVFSVVALFLLFTLTLIISLQRQEAGLLSLVLAFLTVPVFTSRLLLGRPYIFTMAVLMFILFSWPRFNEKKLPWGFFTITTLLIAASTWIHCLWYAFILVILSFILARQWRVAIILSAATALGVIVGTLFTGHPFLFFMQTIMHAIRSFTNYGLTRMLVVEFYPSDGNVLIVMSVIILLLWRLSRKEWNIKRIDNPVFILALIGWVLGLKTQRFWLDWGLVATVVWIAQEFQEVVSAKMNYFSFKRFALGFVVAITLFLIATSDLSSRWTACLNINYLSGDDPKQKEWLPEPGGIFYTADMLVFYQTFYKNPKSEWRYILGFEPTMMPQKDLATYRNIQRTFGALQTYEPWVKKMKPPDRLILRNPTENPSKIKELEWHEAASGLWVGRLPKKAK